MKIIKLTTPWNTDYYAQTPEGKGIFGDYKFEINNECKECDYWIVWGALPEKEEVLCTKENVIYIVDEAFKERSFNQEFLAQFSAVLTLRKDIVHQKIIPIHELCPWYFKKDYEDLLSLKLPKKTKDISMVVSDLIITAGHRKRFAFVNKLIGHFKDRLDVYGRGFNPIPDKWDAIADYKYSIAIENNCFPDYFTEKISECFLSYTMPIYYGCPNIYNYYSPKSMINIDIDNYKESIQEIESLFKDNVYKDRLDYIIASRNKFLEEYHLFPALLKTIKNNFKSKNSNSSLITLIPEREIISGQAKQKIESEIENRDFDIKKSLHYLKKAILNKIK